MKGKYQKKKPSPTQWLAASRILCSGWGIDVRAATLWLLLRLRYNRQPNKSNWRPHSLCGQKCQCRSCASKWDRNWLRDIDVIFCLRIRPRAQKNAMVTADRSVWNKTTLIRRYTIYLFTKYEEKLEIVSVC